jgi:hypothetical protein
LERACAAALRVLLPIVPCTVSPAGAQTIAYRRNQEYPGQSVREN